MAQLRVSESGTHGVRRLAREFIAEALSLLEQRPLSDQAVHSVRKNLKKARAMLRLLRSGIGEATYHRENMALRDAARRLSAIRDTQALLDTFEQLAGAERAASRGPAHELRRALRRAHTRARAELLREDRPVTICREALKSAHRRAGHWRTGERGWSVLGKGLKRVYAQAREALAQAELDPSAESLHECRKQTKYLWHQLQSLEPLRPDAVGRLAERAHRLADLLGDDRNLTLLRHRLDATAGPRGAQAKLRGLIEPRRRALREQALELGHRLYRESPAAFAGRFGRYWRSWRRMR